MPSNPGRCHSRRCAPTLLTKLLDDLRSFSFDGIGDDELVDYDGRFGFLRGNGMMIRPYEHRATR